MLQNGQTGPEITKNYEWALHLSKFRKITNEIFLEVGVVIWHVAENPKMTTYLNMLDFGLALNFDGVTSNPHHRIFGFSTYDVE